MAYWELKKFILTYLEKLTWFYLLATKDHIRQSLRENFVPMQNALNRSYTDRKYYISI